MRLCSFVGCERKFYARDYCNTHYQQMTARGRLTAIRGYSTGKTVKERIEERSYWHPETGCCIWMGRLDHKGYGVIDLDGSPKLAHRQAWLLENGPHAEGKVLDHICGISACVRVEHLRAVSRAENSQYRVSDWGWGRSGLRGVRETPEGRWVASHVKNRRVITIGIFDSIEEAAYAAKEWREENYRLHGEAVDNSSS